MARLVSHYSDLSKQGTRKSGKVLLVQKNEPVVGKDALQESVMAKGKAL